MRLYYYSSSPGVFSGPYDVGTPSASNVQLPNGQFYAVLGGPVPADGVYEAVEASNPAPDDYYVKDDPPVSLGFSGTEGTASGRVTETTNWISRDLEDIRAERIMEVDFYLQFIMTANAASTAAPNWVILLGQGQRSWIADVNARLQDRLERAVTYWPRDVPIAGWQTVNNNRQVVVVDREQWTTVINDISNHGFAATDAWGLVIDAIEAAVDREALVSIDIENSSWGWPPVWVP